ncbi:MAG: ferritin-like domain-containing protein [Acidobacteria bacterium]|nr:ferritin-like domain-containing protein [Acidobacteriota bacterium]
MDEKSQLFVSRRDALRTLALAGGSGLAAIMIAGGRQPVFSQSVEGDLAILTAALYLEHEAIAAYQAGAESGLLPAPIVKVAIAFQGDHKYHRDGIAGAIQTLGGVPAEAERRYRFGALRTDTDILKLARRLEQGAVDAYVTLASNIQNRTVLDFAAHVLADEVRHVTVLKNALGLPNY